MSTRRRRRGGAQRDPSPSPEPMINDDDDHHSDKNNDTIIDDAHDNHDEHYGNDSDNGNDYNPQSQHPSSPSSTSPPLVDPHVDSNTLRILLSTDNHLGYAENDPIRSNDSFAAFEEVLLLAKRHNVDLVLLSGDLFHFNRPSRRTLFRTMNILRRYTMGDRPVSFQIVSDQNENFRSTIGDGGVSYGSRNSETTSGNIVNYEYPFMSIDLPIFSIHGNHDDPTRDSYGVTSATKSVNIKNNKQNKNGNKNNKGANETNQRKTNNNNDDMLAALDILAMGNLVNYFGRQDEIDKVQISPILIKKGTTNVALYGMGSMRDERLNRMWQGKKVRFLKPAMERRSENDSSDNNNDNENMNDSDDEEDKEWFNIFTLHQNRDFGRGTKNCIHESMIPEWMDLVVWGHEHECNIVPVESAVGTFRITQPGSSIATSLSEGESLPKNVGILDIRGSDFRIIPVPLMSVRPFAMKSICLSDLNELDPGDPRVDQVMDRILTKNVEGLIEEARKDSRLLTVKNEINSNEENGVNHVDRGDDLSIMKHLQYHVEKPECVLVRLKVEHSGFSTLLNQRFGTRFVKEVANPSDILLFHRRRSTDSKSSSSKKGSSTNPSSSLPDVPTFPAELDTVNVEDIVRETLHSGDKTLLILDEGKLGVAIEEYVEKEQRQSIDDTVGKIVVLQNKKLIKRGTAETSHDGESKVTTANGVKEACKAETEKNRESQFSMEVDDDEDDERFTRKSARKDSEEYNNESPRGRKKKVAATTKASQPKPRGSTRRTYESESEFEDDEIVEDFSPPRRKRETARTGGRRTATKRNYNEDIIEIDDEEEEYGSSGWGTAKSQASTKRGRRR